MSINWSSETCFEFYSSNPVFLNDDGNLFSNPKLLSDRIVFSKLFVDYNEDYRLLVDEAEYSDAIPGGMPDRIEKVGF